MYKLHLILKYLRKRRIAWVSLIAVMLCTTMVLVVISVMGGWLRMFRQSFHGLSGDVLVEADSLAGIPHYQEMIDRIGKLPEVEAAVPTIRTFGLINIANQIRKGVQVLGLPIERIGSVNKFPESLHRQYEKYVDEGKNPPTPSFGLVPNVPYHLLAPNDKRALERPGMIVGVGVVGIHKDKDGKWVRPDWLYENWAKLTVVQVNPESAVIDLSKSQADTYYWIVDDSSTKVYQYDSQTVYVPFDILQRDLGMDQQQATDPRTGEKITLPARASDIQIKVKPGFDLVAVREKIGRIVDQVRQEQRIGAYYPITVQTWEESQKVWLGAIENEKSLVTFLFGLISIVAIFLIFCIFYMIVVEKTRDIGIIKSVGATSSGVAAIFLGYGTAIGIVGSGLGLLAGYLIVHNINYLHTELGRQLGIVIWNPEVYAFDMIPNTMNPVEVTVILAVAIVASILGALVPAIRAARMNPVESLRWE